MNLPFRQLKSASNQQIISRFDEDVKTTQMPSSTVKTPEVIFQWCPVHGARSHVVFSRRVVDAKSVY